MISRKVSLQPSLPQISIPRKVRPDLNTPGCLSKVLPTTRTPLLTNRLTSNKWSFRASIRSLSIKSNKLSPLIKIKAIRKSTRYQNSSFWKHQTCPTVDMPFTKKWAWVWSSQIKALPTLKARQLVKLNVVSRSPRLSRQQGLEARYKRTEIRLKPF